MVGCLCCVQTPLAEPKTNDGFAGATAAQKNRCWGSSYVMGQLNRAAAIKKNLPPRLCAKRTKSVGITRTTRTKQCWGAATTRSTQTTLDMVKKEFLYVTVGALEKTEYPDGFVFLKTWGLNLQGIPSTALMVLKGITQRTVAGPQNKNRTTTAFLRKKSCLKSRHTPHPPIKIFGEKKAREVRANGVNPIRRKLAVAH